jgi:GTP-binding nuclear protein Ran
LNWNFYNIKQKKKILKIPKMLKITVFGDAGTGKTSFIRKLTNGEYDKRYLATLGCEVSTYNNHSIWDMAGSELYSNMFNAYSHNADFGVAFCNFNSKISYRNIFEWINKFREVNPDKPVYVIINKTDLEHKITPNELLRLNEYVNLILYASAKTTDVNDIKNMIDGFIEENTRVIIRDDIHAKL